jgi:DNA repair protein RAD50
LIAQADERLRKVAKRLTEGLSTLDAKHEELASMRELVGNVEDVAKSAQDRLLEFRSAAKTQENFDNLTAKLEGLEVEIAELNYDEDAVAKERPILDAAVQKLRSNLELREAQLAGEISRPELPEEADLKAHRDKIIQTLQATERPLSGEEAILRHEITEREAASEGICPVCTGKPPIDLSESIADKRQALQRLVEGLDADWSAGHEKLQKELVDIKSQLVEMNESCMIALRRSVDSSRSELRKALSRQQELESRLEEYRRLEREREFLKTQLSAMSPVSFDPSEMEECERVVTDYKNLQSGLAAVEATITAKEAEVERCKEDALVARKECEDLGSVEELPTEQELEEARGKAGILSAKEKERREVLDELASLEVKHQHFSTLVEQLQSQIDTEAATTAWTGVCKRAREILHVSGLPYLMMREYAAKINRRMRHYLNVWEAPFTMKLGDNLAFIAEYPDGRMHSAARLSGGQRIVASTSFRLAMADLVAGQIGLLVLDEPSNCLDQNNKRHLQQLLLKLRDYAGSTGKQVILVTHEERLRGFFDNVINFGIEV